MKHPQGLFLTIWPALICESITAASPILRDISREDELVQVRILQKRSIIIQGSPFTLYKYENENGEIEEVFFNGQSERVQSLPSSRENVMDAEIVKLSNDLKPGQKKLFILTPKLPDESALFEDLSEKGEAIEDVRSTETRTEYFRNGIAMRDETREKLIAVEQKAAQGRFDAITQWRHVKSVEVLEKHPRLKSGLKSIRNGSYILELGRSEFSQIQKNLAEFIGIEEYVEPTVDYDCHQRSDPDPPSSGNLTHLTWRLRMSTFGIG